MQPVQEAVLDPPTESARPREAHTPTFPFSFPALLQAGILGLILVLLLQTFFVETFYVPSGSMAPGLRGEHRQCICRQCGNEVLVGRQEAEGRRRRSDPYRKAFCSWCGADMLEVATKPLREGDRIVVDKLSYLWRRPRRWECVVFQLLGEYVVKRILGLPGEEVLILDGDIYCNGELLRKSWPQIESLQVALFDLDRPGPDGWCCRWEEEASSLLSAADSTPVGGALTLKGLGGTAARTYRNFAPSLGKCVPLTDEQAYNGSLHASWEYVHDFVVEVEVVVKEGAGLFSLELFDGGDQAIVRVPVGRSGKATAGTRNASGAGSKATEQILAEAFLEDPGRTFTLQVAFVDRRLLVRLNGRDVHGPMDLPPRANRSAVIHPLRLEARGVNVECRHLRLARDVHYTQAGRNGVKGRPVRLEAGEYFVLGDNSGRSEDSRFWSGNGAVTQDALLGPARLVLGRR